ncbi:hypothetical protein LSH36_566g01173 [Paralvinella palmiformis]|uniref:Uncharacterized protein n=1 Tax=Paralvinella palmiformis TaxID=53620 RepID=A0AAD9MWX8_9ANNE|nr:hypothetical protein LSH36_566g01173 [Paralvinella palmiformis]
MIGLYPASRTFFTMAAGIVLFSFARIAEGHLWASISRDPELVFTFLTFSNHMQLLFTGFLIKPGFFSIFKIIQVTCSSGYAFQILVVSQWKNIKYLQCESTYKIDHEHSNIDTRLNQDNSALCFHNGREVLESFGYDTDSIGYCFCIMILLTIVIEVLSYIALISKVKRAK